MNNALSVFTRTEILDYAYKIERVSIDEHVVTFNREDVTLDVQYKRVSKGFVVCLDIRVLGPHSYWIQGNCAATDEDKAFWTALNDKEFDMRNAASDEYAAVVDADAAILAQGILD